MPTFPVAASEIPRMGGGLPFAGGYMEAIQCLFGVTTGPGADLDVQFTIPKDEVWLLLLARAVASTSFAGFRLDVSRARVASVVQRGVILGDGSPLVTQLGRIDGAVAALSYALALPGGPIPANRDTELAYILDGLVYADDVLTPQLLGCTIGAPGGVNYDFRLHAIRWPLALSLKAEQWSQRL